MNLKIAKQLIREFLIPIIASSLWVAVAWIKNRNLGLVEIINTFGATFFLISWMSSQYFRVSKQNRTEGELNKIQTNVQVLISELDKKTKTLTELLTGEGSFCKLSAVHVNEISTEHPEKLIINLNHEGKYPIYDVNSVVMILLKPRPGGVLPPMMHKKMDLGTITKGTGKELIQFPCADLDEIIVSCVTTTRVGIETNCMRGWRVGENMKFALKTERDSTCLYCLLPDDTNEEISWNKWRG